MPTLLECPSEQALRLLQRVATGYLDAGGQWRCGSGSGQGSTPTGSTGKKCSGGCRPGSTATGRCGQREAHTGPLPDLGDRVALTAHGLVHVSGVATDHMLNAFPAALAEAQEAQADSVSMPTEVVKIELEGADFTQRVNKRAGGDQDDEEADGLGDKGRDGAQDVGDGAAEVDSGQGCG